MDGVGGEGGEWEGGGGGEGGGGEGEGGGGGGGGGGGRVEGVGGGVGGGGRMRDSVGNGEAAEGWLGVCERAGCCHRQGSVMSLKAGWGSYLVGPCRSMIPRVTVRPGSNFITDQLDVLIVSSLLQ